MNHAINPIPRLDMNSLYLLIGILGIAIGFFAYYASVHDKVNALGRYTKPAIAFVVLCGVLLLALSIAS
jgi:Ni,Fe-hydrogenase I cytochrome b subunit